MRLDRGLPPLVRLFAQSLSDDLDPSLTTACIVSKTAPLPFLRRSHHPRFTGLPLFANRKTNTPGVKVRPSINLPVLEDANSVQVAIMQVMGLLLAGQVEHKTAALLLYGLQTASGNLRHVRFEAYPPRVVIDPDTVDQTLMGEDNWENSDFNDSEEDGDEEDDEEAGGAEKEKEDEENHSLEKCVAVPALKASAETSPANKSSPPSENWKDEIRTRITDIVKVGRTAGRNLDGTFSDGPLGRR